MPRYVEIDDVEVSDYVTVWDCNCSEFGKQTVMAVDDLQYLPTADVVPKSEVEETTGKYEDLKLKYADLQKDKDELIAWVDDKKTEVARDIFAEIEKYKRSPMPECKPVYVINDSGFSELKKKYIPQNDDRCVVCGEIIPEGRQVCLKCQIEKGD